MFLGLRHDLIYALRMLRKNKTFSAVAILTLALGIGANTAIFSVVNGVLLRPLPYRDSSRLALFRLDLGQDKSVCSFSFPELKDFQTQTRLLEDATAYSVFSGAVLTIGDQSEPVTVASVWSNFHSMLGVEPMMGRSFRPNENFQQAAAAILSYEFWRNHFGSDPHVVGKTVQLFGLSYQIAGVMPAGFEMPDVRVFHGTRRATLPPDLFTPLFSNTNRGGHFLRALGRLKPGVSIAQAQAELTGLATRWNQQYSEYRPDGVRLMIEPLQGDIVHSARPVIVALACAVGFVLLIACSNVASLLIARSKTREREIAVRAAIGASGWALARQALVESVVLAMIAGGLGIGLAFEGVRVLKLFKPSNLPRLDSVQLDMTVLLVSAAISLAIGLLFGMLPAMRAARLNLAESLRGGTRSSRSISSNPIMRILVIGEVALCLVLLISSGLMIRTFQQLQRVDPGFDVTRTLTFQGILSFQPGQTLPMRQQYYSDLQDRIAALPGVQSVGATSLLPFAGLIFTGPFAYSPETLARWGSLTADYRIVTPGYLETMRTKLRSGRFFIASDGVNQNQAIVDENFARMAWPGQNPAGQRVWLMDDFTGNTSAAAEVVGVVQHMRYDQLSSEGHPQVYLPARLAGRQNLGQAGAFCVRTAGDPSPLIPAIRKLAHEVNSNALATEFETLESRLSKAMAGTEFELTLMSVFAGIAVVLALVGLYGVISHMVSERWREMGIRIALGASPGDVRQLVLGQGLRLTAMGVAIGIGAAFLVTPLFRSMLYGVAPTDFPTFAVLSLLMLLISMLACYIPARRATRADPIEAMRAE
jgi:putative ABC transport system permease protein